MMRVQTIAAAVLLLSGAALVRAQEPPTATPVIINLSPVAQQALPQDDSAPTPTRTPTEQGVALLEAKDFANVRAEPSTDSAQLGQIKAGETYNVIGRYVSWIQFQFPSSPTGKGWVFGDLVTLSGNVQNIPDIDPYAAQSPQDNVAAAASATQAVITQTPGGVLTATVLARIVPGTDAPTSDVPQGPLPTFTYPPNMVAIAPTPGLAASATPQPNQLLPVPGTGQDVPPLVPIVILGGVGLLGLLISSIRRG
jgi:hypothetical protein